ncbi:hypothetical protein AVEN_71485-1 [Araneus ventricosus]|uniref:Uncharacterized protein n=1 Tax=Araneus ventricosus TaxID=182803 RepID=A0A4Y2UDE1_ARAVE|nr:hypothetical protein AVEN_201665-1 [Araneus ventricosus]GBO10553.1 hypothetical protein AVEN_71485-1 [Araneus ventricosus]
MLTEHTTSRLTESGLTPAARLQRSLDQRVRNRIPGHFHPSPIWNTAGTPGLHFPPYGTPYTANFFQGASLAPSEIRILILTILNKNNLLDKKSKGAHIPGCVTFVSLPIHSGLQMELLELNKKIHQPSPIRTVPKALC